MNNNNNANEKWRPITITNASNRMRTGRSMPEWMSKSGKGGPVPPPPPSPRDERSNGGRRFARNSPPPDPEYEVIECPSSTQYMNSAPPPLPAKNQENGRRGDGRHCDLCGSGGSSVRCEQCASQIFCLSCDEMYHRHPKRQTHVRKPVDTMFRPPLPPKGESVSAPVPPPRRNKRPGSAASRHGPPSPSASRKEQGAPHTGTAILDRMGSLKRMISNPHRPLPATPNDRPQATRQPPEPPVPTPGATLDSRLSSLQERYRQHQEAMRNMTPARRDSNASSRQMDAPLAPRENFNDWETSELSRMRSGSVSGLDRNALQNMRGAVSPPLSQMGAGSRAGSVRGMSASVFDLNRAGMMSPGMPPMHQHQQGYNPNAMQQAQSMAQLNCMSCQHGMWPAQNPQLSGSNLSLNMPPQGYHPHDYPPPVWMGPWGQPMYPGYPMGMMPGMMNNGTLPRRRSGSRAGSPTLSLKSRKSHVSRNSRRQVQGRTGSGNGPVLADDEESDDEDDRMSYRGTRHRRESLSSRRRHRLNSTTQSSLEDDLLDDEILERESIRSRQNSRRNQEENRQQVHRKTSTVSDRTNDSGRNHRRTNNNTVAASRKLASSVSDIESAENQQIGEDAAPLGPPPSPPSHDWECEHCTFVNAPGVTICGVCCKTPSSNARLAKPTEKQNASEVVGVENSMKQMKITSAGEDSSDGKKKGEIKEEQPIPDTEKPQNVLNTSLDIKDNISVKSDKQSKVSTGCGPSPPREIPLAKSDPKSETKSTSSANEAKHTASTGTSPPPQSISTQTYDELPAHILAKEKDEEEQRSSRTPRGLRRSHSMHMSRRSSQAPSPLHRSSSRQSFSSDTQSLPNTPPRELSPTRYDDEILAIAERALASRYHDHPQRTYRSILDLRKPDLYQPRRPSYADTHQSRSERGGRRARAESQPPDSILEDLINRRRADVMKSQGLELVRMLREAEQSKYTAEELQAAMAHCPEGSDPVAWLRSNWSNMIDTVRTLATNYGHERRENTVGTLSAAEARDALRQHRGNVWAAVTECVEQRQKKYAELMSRGNFTREDVVTSLTAHHGDIDAALMELNKSQLKPFLMRIWGPPAGIENDSANSAVENRGTAEIPKTAEDSITKLMGALNLGGGPGRAEPEAGSASETKSLKDFISENADKQALASEAAIASTRAVSRSPNNTEANQERAATPKGESPSSKTPNHRREEIKAQSSSQNILDDLQAALITIETNQNTQKNSEFSIPENVKDKKVSESIDEGRNENIQNELKKSQEIIHQLDLMKSEIEPHKKTSEKNAKGSDNIKNQTNGLTSKSEIDNDGIAIAKDANKEAKDVSTTNFTNQNVELKPNSSSIVNENVIDLNDLKSQNTVNEDEKYITSVLATNELNNTNNMNKVDENAPNFGNASAAKDTANNKYKSKKKNRKKVKQKPDKETNINTENSIIENKSLVDNLANQSQGIEPKLASVVSQGQIENPVQPKENSLEKLYTSSTNEIQEMALSNKDDTVNNIELIQNININYVEVSNTNKNELQDVSAINVLQTDAKNSMQDNQPISDNNIIAKDNGNKNGSLGTSDTIIPTTKDELQTVEAEIKLNENVDDMGSTNANNISKNSSKKQTVQKSKIPIKRTLSNPKSHAEKEILTPVEPAAIPPDSASTVINVTKEVPKPPVQISLSRNNEITQVIPSTTNVEHVIGKEETESFNIVEAEEKENLQAQKQVGRGGKSPTSMKIIEVIVSNTSEESDGELYSESDSDEYDEEIQEHLPETKIEEQVIPQADAQTNGTSSQTNIELAYRDIVTSPPVNRQQNLSEIVEDTHRIIKQMKDEINSDMASYVSDGERNSGSSYESTDYSGSEWSNESDSEVFSTEGEEEFDPEDESYEDESGEEESVEGSNTEDDVDDNISSDEQFSEAKEDLGIPQEVDNVTKDNKEIVLPEQAAIETDIPDNKDIINTEAKQFEILQSNDNTDNNDANIILVPNNDANINPIPSNDTSHDNPTEENLENHDIKENTPPITDYIAYETNQNEKNIIANNVIDNKSVAELIEENDAKNILSITSTDPVVIQQSTQVTVENDIPVGLDNSVNNEKDGTIQDDEFILILNTVSPPAPENEIKTVDNSKEKQQPPTIASNQSVTKKDIPHSNFKISNVKRLQQGLLNKSESATSTNKNIGNKSKANVASSIPKRVEPKNVPAKVTTKPSNGGSPTKTEIKSVASSSKAPSKITKENNVHPTSAKENAQNKSAAFDNAQGSSQGKSDADSEKKKKNYFRESCFSDEDVLDDEPPPKPKIEKMDEVPKVEKDIATIEKDEEEEKRKTMLDIAQNIIESEPVERQARRFLAEGLVRSFSEAELAVTLLDLKFDAESALYASRECGTLDAAIAFLQQECELCTGKYPMHQMVSMLRCVHRCCKECARNYFTIQITDRAITDCVCPFCKDPDLTAADEDDILDYFSHLDILLKGILDGEVHELFQRKLRDRTLMQDPNFKWCVKCSSGFFAHPRQKRLICPDCRSVTCAQCRRPWEKQHEGITCEKFAEWKEANDPDVQAEGVARHLRENGIDCPKCKFRYALSRGGCMHFTCSQCKYEFCCGCGKPFTMGAKCGVSPYCGKLGLHAHHPRNCLFYLRDKEPHELQRLLKINNVAYDVEPPPVKELPKDEDGAVGGIPVNKYGPERCHVQLQKETPGGMVDSICSADVLPGQAGLCRGHYVEYLVARVREAGLDPLPAMDLTECVQELRRRGIALPERGPWDTDDIYRGMCQKIVLDQIPLD